MGQTTLIAMLLVLDFGLDFIVGAGGTVLGAIGATGNATLPSWGVLFTAGVVGLVAAARRAQSVIAAYLKERGVPTPDPPPAR